MFIYFIRYSHSPSYFYFWVVDVLYFLDFRPLVPWRYAAGRVYFLKTLRSSVVGRRYLLLFVFIYHKGHDNQKYSSVQYSVLKTNIYIHYTELLNKNMSD